MGIYESMIDRDKIVAEQLKLSKSIEENLSVENLSLKDIPKDLLMENMIFHSTGMSGLGEPSRAHFWVNNEAGKVPELNRHAIEKIITILKNATKEDLESSNLTEATATKLIEEYSKAIGDMMS
jgi:hypothetical protein